MTVTTATLTRAAGLSAVTAGLLFVGVQIKHPHLDLELVTTTEWAVRQTMKVFMAALSLIGITGVYLHQVRRIGVLGLLGYVLFGTGYLVLFGIEVVAGYVLPSIASSAPGYVTDVLALAGGGSTTGDVGALRSLNALASITYLSGGFVFGIALFRARVLARWAAALLAAGTVSTIGIVVLPQVNARVFAIPTGVAMIGLGYSLWRQQRESASAAAPLPSPAGSQLDPAGVR